MSIEKHKKIIWAVDAYGDAKVQASAAALAKIFSKNNDVQVVYIHGSSGFPVEGKKTAIRFGLSRTEYQLKKILNELDFKPPKKPKILAHGSTYVRSDVKTLVSYAKKIKADLILLSTNARIGFMRQALGSFAETMILESKVPTMIVNPKAEVTLQPGTILFPTDFSNSSWKAFQQVVGFAKATDAKVKIFHQYQGEQQAIPHSVTYFHSNRWLKGNSLQDKDFQKIKVKLSKWLNWSKKQNIKCDHIIKFGLKNIADATRELARKERVWMIAMATMTGSITSTFLGSNARSLVRSARCPVWVLFVKENK